MQQPTNWPLIRDIFLFVGGMAGIFHETVIADTERPTLLVLFAAMSGLPGFLRKDEPQKGVSEDGS